MRNNSAKNMALCGVTAALAVVIMCLGGLIPVATYVCPMLCAVILSIVLRQCGEKMAWVWYGAVSILSVLMGPDKEAAAVFLFLGYYPIVKPKLDRLRFGRILKLLLFNCAIGLMYWLLIAVLGMEDLVEESEELGIAMLMVLMVMGNVTFFLLDRLLCMKPAKKHRDG